MPSPLYVRVLAGVYAICNFGKTHTRSCIAQALVQYNYLDIEVKPERFFLRILFGNMCAIARYRHAVQFHASIILCCDDELSKCTVVRGMDVVCV